MAKPYLDFVWNSPDESMNESIGWRLADKTLVPRTPNSGEIQYVMSVLADSPFDDDIAQMMANVIGLLDLQMRRRVKIEVARNERVAMRQEQSQEEAHAA